VSDPRMNDDIHIFTAVSAAPAGAAPVLSNAG
jgi:hypothetical protein